MSTTTDPINDVELTNIWANHAQAEAFILEAMKARKDGEPLINQVSALDKASVVMADNKTALQLFRNSIIIPD